MKAILCGILLLTTAIANANGSENENSGAYVGTFGGSNFMKVQMGSSNNSMRKCGIIGGFALGYKTPSDIRVEAELAIHIPASLRKASRNMTLQNTIYSMMGNVYYDFNLGYLTPYIGLGSGFAKTDFSGRGRDEFSLKESQFVYQGIVGIGRQAWDNTDLAIEYRQLRFKDRLADHAAVLAIRHYY